jgi:CO dehydrogenase maturation factor
MRVAVGGKGGSGKTTIAGTLARVLAQGDRRILAIDADSNPNMAATIGIPGEVSPMPADILVEVVDEKGERRRALGMAPEQLVERFAAPGPDEIGRAHV